MRELSARLHLVTSPSFPKPSQWLTPAELRMFERIRAQRRRQDWLAGRWAAKELIQKYSYEQTGRELAPSQIEILNDANGAPYGRVRLELGTSHFALSLAHSAGHGLAGLSLHGRIGVDLQQIRSVRSDLTERVLSERERAQLTEHFAESDLKGLLVFWALKEAAIKAWRTRPAPALHEITVKLTEPGHAEIRMWSWKLTAQWGRWRKFIWAWAQPVRTSTQTKEDAILNLKT